MTGFMVVDGAAQHGLATIGTLLILILFTSCFPAYVLYIRIVLPILPAAAFNAQTLSLHSPPISVANLLRLQPGYRPPRLLCRGRGRGRQRDNLT